MFAQNQGLDLSRRHLQPARQIAAKPGGIELGAKAEDPLPGQAGALNGEICQHVDGITNDEQVAVFFETGRLGLFEKPKKEIDVAVDEIEPALLWLPPQASRHDHHVAQVEDIAHVAGGWSVDRPAQARPRATGRSCLP